MKHVVRAIALVLTLLWIAFIFGNSLDSGAESSAKSSTVHEVVNEVAASLGAKEEISEKTIRTSAHFAEFAVLSLLFCIDAALFFSLSPARRFGRDHLSLLLSLPVALLTAGIDEWLQRLSPGRACQFIDVLVDFAGAICGMLFFVLVFAFIRLIAFAKQKKKEENENTST